MKKLKYPKSMEVMGKIIPIKLDENIEDSAQLVDCRVLLINPRLNSTTQELHYTLVHEFIHVIFNMTGWSKTLDKLNEYLDKDNIDEDTLEESLTIALENGLACNIRLLNLRY